MLCAGGGHGYEIRKLVEGLSDGLSFVYAVSRDMSPSALNAYPKGPVFKTIPVVLLREKTLRRVLRLLFYSLQALWIMLRVRPSAIVTVGTSSAVPFMFWGRIFFCKNVFVESITRVHTLSNTGKILSRFRLCQRLYVQWPEAAENNSRVLYKGVVV